jgi:DNA polymerase I-like protein with 3'-5' exonuclease and polymerase domains
MKLLTLDFETYYDSKLYTLKKMTTEEYIRDSRFEVLGLGVYIPSHEKKMYVEKPHIKEFLEDLELPEYAVICHHAQFDCLILAHHFGVQPKFIFDTISMARFVHGRHQSCSLAKLAELYDLPEKTVPYNLFDGKRYHELSSGVRAQMMDGCIHDCELTYKIFKELIPQISEPELQFQDINVRMFTNPRLIGDIDGLVTLSQKEIDEKEKMINDLAVSEKQLQSADMFCALLRGEDVEIETKVTKAGNVKPAIAKTDEFMKELLEHENPRVRALAEARLGVKSTINETRAGRILRMAERGPLCVYLHQPGTHTLRCAGGDKMNFQNMPGGGDLRHCVCAPDDYRLAMFDLKQIELRTELWLAGDTCTLEALRNGDDLYKEMAALLYNIDIQKVVKEQRSVGKEIVLGCGYGMGWEKLKNTCAIRGITIPDSFAKLGIQTYRGTYREIVNLWKEGEVAIAKIDSYETFDWGIFHIEDKKLYAPTGAFVHFDNIYWESGEDRFGKPGWRIETRPGKIEKLYGAKFIEHVNQFLARCVYVDRVNAVKKIMKLSPVLSTHDDAGYLIPEQQVGFWDIKIKKIFEQTPDWIKGLPLEVEYKVLERYE